MNARARFARHQRLAVSVLVTGQSTNNFSDAKPGVSGGRAWEKKTLRRSRFSEYQMVFFVSETSTALPKQARYTLRYRRSYAQLFEEHS